MCKRLSTVNRILCILIFASCQWNNLAIAENPQNKSKIDESIATVQTLCLSGTQYDLNVDGKGTLFIQKLKPGAEGGISISSRDSRGATAITDQTLRYFSDEKTRDCMKPYIPMILAEILGSRSPAKKTTHSNRKSKAHKKSRDKEEARSPRTPHVKGGMTVESPAQKEPTTEATRLDETEFPGPAINVRYRQHGHAEAKCETPEQVLIRCTYKCTPDNDGGCSGIKVQRFSMDSTTCKYDVESLNDGAIPNWQAIAVCQRKSTPLCPSLQGTWHTDDGLNVVIAQVDGTCTFKSKPFPSPDGSVIHVWEGDWDMAAKAFSYRVIRTSNGNCSTMFFGRFLSVTDGYAPYRHMSTEGRCGIPSNYTHDGFLKR